MDDIYKELDGMDFEEEEEEEEEEFEDIKEKGQNK